MIPKISSNDLNNMFTESKEELDRIHKRFETSKSDIEKKLEIIKAESDYVFKLTEEIMHGNYQPESYKTFLPNCKDGKFSTYGSTVYPKFIKEPINVFNLNMSGIGEHFFREDVKVSINNIEKDIYTNVLKHDSIKTKEINFDNYKDNKLKLTIQLSDISNLLGPTRFNMIEIDPYLPGSFSIDKLTIFVFDSNGEVSPEEKEFYFENVSKSRILLDQKYNFYKMEFDITLNLQSYKNDSVVYPFGLKHLYLLEADFTKENYVIVPIVSNLKDKYISIIKNDIRVQTPQNTRDTQINLEDIEIYIDYDPKTGELTSRVEPSTPDSRKEIARNTKKLYAKVPLKNKESLIAIQFDIENKLY